MHSKSLLRSASFVSLLIQFSGWSVASAEINFPLAQPGVCELSYSLPMTITASDPLPNLPITATLSNVAEARELPLGEFVVVPSNPGQPVVITNLSHLPGVLAGGRGFGNGIWVNPPAMDGQTPQPFDDHPRIYDTTNVSTPPTPYDSSLESTLPVSLNIGDVMVQAIASERVGLTGENLRNGLVEDYLVIHVVSSLPQGEVLSRGSFGAKDANATFYPSDVAGYVASLTQYPLPSPQDSSDVQVIGFDEWDARIRGLSLGMAMTSATHKFTGYEGFSQYALGRKPFPSQNDTNYGRYQKEMFAIGTAMLLLDSNEAGAWTIAQKEKAVTEMATLGAHFYTSVMQSYAEGKPGYRPDGGHNRAGLFLLMHFIGATGGTAEDLEAIIGMDSPGRGNVGQLITFTGQEFDDKTTPHFNVDSDWPSMFWVRQVVSVNGNRVTVTSHVGEFQEKRQQLMLTKYNGSGASRIVDGQDKPSGGQFYVDVEDGSIFSPGDQVYFDFPTSAHRAAEKALGVIWSVNGQWQSYNASSLTRYRASGGGNNLEDLLFAMKAAGLYHTAFEPAQKIANAWKQPDFPSAEFPYNVRASQYRLPNYKYCKLMLNLIDEYESGGTYIDTSGNIWLGEDYAAYDQTQDGQNNKPTGISVSTDGVSVTLTGNAWKRFPLNYTVTNNTVLQFTVDTSNLGEIIGVALEDDENRTNTARSILVGGSEVDGINYTSWSFTHPDYYTASSGTKTYTIPVGQDYFTGDVVSICFIADDDSQGASNVTFSDLKIFEDTSGGVASTIIDFGAAVLSAYSGSQDGNGQVLIEDGGATLRLIGNRWQKIAFTGNITFNTLLEFDVEIATEGELVGIGFDNDDDYTSGASTIFKIAGLDSAPTTWLDFSNDFYSVGSSGNVVIPVGQYYTGSFQYLAFISDHDFGAQNSDVSFSNVRILEGLLVDFDDYAIESYSNQDNQNGTWFSQAIPAEGGVTLNLQGNAWKRIGFASAYTVTPNTMLEFEVSADPSDSAEIIAIGFEDDDILDNDIRLFQLGGEDVWTNAYQDANAYTSGTEYFSICVGQFYTGDMTHLVLCGDDDGSGAANVTFKNIKIYEDN